MASNKSRGSGVTTPTQPLAPSNPPQNQIPIQPLQQDQVVPTPQQAQNSNAGNFSDHDDAEYHDLYNGRGYFQRQVFGIDSEIARQNYLASNPEAVQWGGDGIHSLSQNMNWEMMNHLPMSPTHRATMDGLNDALHNLGYNLNLQRYDHDDFVNGLLQQAGVKGANYMNMTESQLKGALVGHGYSEERFLSTSYNDFKNATDPSTFTSRAVRIEYRAKASTQAFMPGDGPGGRLGEIIIGPNTPSRIVDVRLSPVMNARTKGTQSYNRRQITLVVEIG